MTMLKSLRTAALAVVFVASALALAQSGALATRVDLFLKDADLLQATQVLTRQTGIQFIIEPSLQPFEKVNLALNGVTAEDAIRYICQAAGAYAERDANGVFVIRRGAAPEVKPAPEPAPSPKYVVRKIRLMKADPKFVFDMLTRGVSAQADPMEAFRDANAASQIARGAFGDYGKPNLTVVGQGAPAYAFPLSNQGGNTGRVEPTDPGQGAPGQDSGSNVVLPGEEARQNFGGGGGFQPGGGGGQPGGGAGQPGGGGVQLQEGQGLVPQGIPYISYDPTDNSIVVQGTDDAIRQLRERIAFFDTAPKQVLIKVEFITTSSSTARSLGFDWLYQRGSVFAGNRPGTFARAGDPIFINYATGNITTRLRTLLQTGQGKVVNAPVVRTLNNQIALVQQAVATTIFINQVVNAPGGVTIVPQPFPLTVATQLVVRPRINGDGTITMNLTPQIQDFGQVRRGPDGQEIPDQLSQLINVVARVKNGETIVLAGLTRKSEQSSESRFPILGDLPIIGQFFRSNNRDQNSSELLIFVTPTIIEDDESSVTGP
jgi:type II secretory pathway component GspD/PulD (secretin)